MSQEELLTKLKIENEELKSKLASFEEIKSELAELKENFSQLKSDYDKLQAETERTNKKYDQLLHKAEEKNHIIKVANHNKYYTTSEPSFEASPINEVEAIEEAKCKRGRPIGSKNYDGVDFESLASETITIDIAPDLIKKGFELIKIGEDISYLIDIKKDLKVIKVVNPKYINKKEKDGQIYQEISNKIFPHSIATPALVADVINAKYNLDVPLYRYSKYLISQGIPLSDMDLTNFVKRADEKLQPLYELIRSSLINQTSNVLHSDETPIKVLDYFKNENRKNGYVFAYVSSYYDNPIYLYDFNKTRKTDKTQEILEGFEGYVVCDGYAGYNELTQNNIKLQRCFAHIRRKFYDIVKVLSPNLRNQSAAYEMVKKIDQLFYLEKQFKYKKLTPNQIYEARHKEDYLIALNDIYDYLDSIKTEKDTPLDKAVKYFKEVKEESKTFLEDGHIPISNNLAERTIKPFTIMRRNVLFSKTENGATITSRIFTIVQTARANGIIVDRYLEYLLYNIDRIPLKDLLPWSKHISEKFSVFQKK